MAPAAAHNFCMHPSPNDDWPAWLRLLLTDGVGRDTARRLLAALGSAPAIFQASPAQLQALATPRQVQALLQEPPELAAHIARTRHWLAQASPTGARTVWTLGDADYPPQALQLADPPLLLYAEGCAVLQAQRLWAAPALAIVGSRNPTHQGRQTAQQMAQALCGAGCTVVSGLALGIDGAAHQGALDAAATRGAHDGLTIAVVGTGLDRVYPRQHQALARDIAAHGLLLSEYPLGTPPLAAHFPQRNRLIAALGLGTLVVEAALHSGSLITADLALELGREVLAIPGSIHAPQSRGCHALIRQGATLVESVQDVWQALGPHARLASLPATPSDASMDAAALGDADAALLQHLGFDPVSLDALQARCGLDTATLQARLLTLELDARVGRLPGGLFQRLG